MTQVTLKGNPVSLFGKMPTIGQKAHPFTLVDKDLKERTLSEFQGKKKLLWVVPSLDTPTCAISTKKLAEFAKEHPEIAILVISADLPFAQSRFCLAEKISSITTLSSMRGHQFGKDYGILIEEGPIAGLLARSLFILDANDTLLYTQLVSEITSEPDYSSAFQALR